MKSVRFRLDPFAAFRFAILFCLVPTALSCARAAPGPKAAAPAGLSPSSVAESAAASAETPKRSAPLEAPVVSMRTLAKAEPARPPSERPDLSIPSGSETLRPPRDYSIGILGPQGAAKAPYLYALDAARTLAAGRSIADRFPADGAAASAEALRETALLGAAPIPRLGSPAAEADGGVSYLFRFFGSEASLTGEIRLLLGEDGGWLVEAIYFDAPTDKKDGADPTADPLIFKRFL